MTDKSIRRTEKFMRHAMAAHGGSVYLVALAQTRSEADAQDVAQDVFCRLLTGDTAFTSDEHLRADPVWQALQSLPEKLRVVALLHYVEEYTTKEIARIVGSPPATVRTRLHRARKQMRETLESPASPAAEEENYGQAHA